MVHRGKDGCEIMLILLLFKICYPAHVFLNRGNHEAGNVTEIYGFKAECTERKYDEEVYDAFIELFECLPLGTIVENVVSKKRVFVVHGGLYSKYEEYDLEWVSKPGA